MMDDSRTHNYFYQYSLSAISGSVAEIATYPLDLTKTRLQIQGEHGTLDTLPKRGMITTASGIVQQEGVTCLWQGITPAITRQIIYSGFRMVIYEQLREHIFKRNYDGSFPLWKAMCCGAICGALGNFLSTPTDLVKVQMQMEGRRRLMGLEPRVLGMRHALNLVFSRGGIRGLWTGWIPCCQRAAVINMADLATYDTAKQELVNHMGDTYVTHIAASMISGLVQTVVSTPIDVVKSRIMNQPTNDTGHGLLYKGSIDCLIKTVKDEGPLALYKGFMPLWIRLGSWTLTFWVSYEQLRKLVGARGF